MFSFRAATSAARLASARSAMPLRNVIRTNLRNTSRRTLTGSAGPEQKELVKQRLNRPIAPHLSIYKPQVTWYLSSLTRITGFILSGSFYLYFLLYLAGPWIGLHIESLGLKEKVANLNKTVKYTVKGVLAWAFSFHVFNGFRHLVWDTGALLTNGAVIKSGWTVVGLTAISTAYLLFQ